MDQDEIAAILLGALEALYQEERVILRLDVAERTLCTQLRAILQRSFANHSVHAEYNRHGISPKEIELPDADGSLTMTRVFPDIIVHQPLHDEENLLVIEAKKSTNPISDNADLVKLTQMKQQLGYSFAAFIRLPAGPDADFANIAISWV